MAMRGGKKQHRGAGETISPEGIAVSERPPLPERLNSERRCAVSGVSQSTENLIRFALGPDGVVPDVSGRLPGRGVWVTCTYDQVLEATKKKLFARGFKQQVACPADLPEVVERLLRRRASDRISLANKAGLACAGFSKVEATLRDGSIAVLLHGSDAAVDGCRKLDGLARIGAEITGNAPKIVSNFKSDELSLAFGRSNVVHAALKQGGASASFLKDLERLENYTAGAEVVERSTDGTETRDRRNTEQV